MRPAECRCTGTFRHLNQIRTDGRHFIHPPVIRVFRGLLGMPPAMLSGKSAEHYAGQAADECCRMSPMRAAYR
jgi:hypothetical protein